MPCLQVLLWDQIWWEKCTWKTPSANTINDIHGHLGVKQLEVNVEIALIVKQDLPLTWTGSEQWDITYHQCMCMFS